MKKFLIIIYFFSLTLNLFAQRVNERKIDLINSESGGLIEITEYRQADIDHHGKSSVKSVIIKYVNNGEVNYFFDINEVGVHSLIAYEDINNVLNGIEKLKIQVASDKENIDIQMKNKIINSDGFVIGYDLIFGKVTWFFTFGGLMDYAPREYLSKSNGFSEQQTDVFSLDSGVSKKITKRIKKIANIENALISAKEKIEELKSND